LPIRASNTNKSNSNKSPVTAIRKIARLRATVIVTAKTVAKIAVVAKAATAVMDAAVVAISTNKANARINISRVNARTSTSKVSARILISTNFYRRNRDVSERPYFFVFYRHVALVEGLRNRKRMG